MEVNIKSIRVEIVSRTGLLRLEEYKELFGNILKEKEIAITDSNLKTLAKIIAKEISFEEIELEYERLIDNIELSKEEF